MNLFGNIPSATYRSNYIPCILKSYKLSEQWVYFLKEHIVQPQVEKHDRHRTVFGRRSDNYSCDNEESEMRVTIPSLLPFLSPQLPPALPHASHRLPPHRVSADPVHKKCLLTCFSQQTVILKRSKGSPPRASARVSWIFADGASPLLILVV